MSRRAAGIAATTALVTTLLALGARGQEAQGPPVAPPPVESAPVESAPADPGPADPAAVSSPAVAAASSSSPPALTTAAPDRAPAASAAPRGLRMRGMTVPLQGVDPDLDLGPALAELPALGVTHVAFYVDLWQADVTSPAPARHPLRTPPDRAVRRAISAARALALEVVLAPCLQLERPGARERRGRLQPPSWERWFAGYRRALLHWARLAEDEGVALLALGGGLATAEDEEARWRALIRDVRAEFSGELTYSASRDRVAEVRFWDALDHVGIAASFELTSSTEPTPEELERAWGRQRAALTAWRERRGLDRPLVLFEVGYPSRDGGAAEPWNDALDTSVDLEEQRQCYEAFAATWRDAPPLLAGAFFHAWAGEGGRRDGGHTPRGKPAAEVVKAFFGGREAP